MSMHLKLMWSAALLLAALVFSVQDAGVADVQCLAWKSSMSPALVVFATLAAGLAAGWAVASALRLKGKVNKD